MLLSYTTGRAVFGTCRVIAIVKNNTVNKIEELNNYPYLERFIESFNGVVDFFFSMNELLAVSGRDSLNELEVYVEAQVEDPYYLELSNGSFITTLYDPRIDLKFLGKQPRAFKPNSPYTTFVAVSQQDGTPLPEAMTRRMFVKFKIETNGGGSFSRQSIIPLGPNCIVSYTFTPDINTEFITVTASLIDQNGLEDPYTVIVERAIRYKSISQSYIHVTSSTAKPEVGDYMIFTVRVR